MTTIRNFIFLILGIIGAFIFLLLASMLDLMKLFKRETYKKQKDD